ncbi:MAG: hypothetical protein IPN29_06985 [Saprospiraceae bacterium]|nr:hypothetical protein [Saprospiraceae bacterium]
MQQQNETSLLIVILAIGYILNFVLGMLGSFFPPNSYPQMTLWQIGDSMAIMGSVLASRYVASRGQNIAAAGFTLFGIAYGVSFASSAINAVNEEKMATIILPLVPALFLISFCKIFPTWLRIGSLLVCVPFFYMYENVIQETYHHDNLSNVLAYFGIQLLGVLWTVIIYKDYIKQSAP